MNGIDILQALRSDPATRDVTVVMINAHDNSHSIHRVVAAGADNYLAKPSTSPNCWGGWTRPRAMPIDTIETNPNGRPPFVLGNHHNCPKVTEVK